MREGDCSSAVSLALMAVASSYRSHCPFSPSNLNREETDCHALALQIPELCALRSVVENSDAHVDTPWEQALRLCAWVKGLPESFAEIVSPSPAMIKNVLAHRVGSRSVHDLLAFAALLHDVGKAETLVRLPDGTTRCAGHERVGARLAVPICARWGLSDTETDFVVGIIAHHGDPNVQAKRAAKGSQADVYISCEWLATHDRAIVRPLLLLACGDLVTSHLRNRQPDKFQLILGVYRVWARLLLSQPSFCAHQEGKTR